jgi:hypothetical protein
MHWKIKLPWQSTKKERDIAILKQQKPTGADCPSYSTYRSITELPLSRWIDLTVNGYNYAVVKSGNPPEHEVLNIISFLRQEYADAAGDGQYKMYCNLIKEITEKEITLTEIHNLVETLRDVYNPLLAKALNKLLGASLVFDVTKPNEYDKNLDRAINRSKSISINIALKNISLKAMEEKYAGSNLKPSNEYYLGILITLREDNGYHISPENITVWEFCEMIRRYNIKSKKKK